ncbi:MAG: vitamin K epoxide reductase family protein [Fimbriimonadaceae bacterium]
MARILKFLSLLLPLGGLFVAGYLSIKYATGGEIACGKSGDCGQVAMWVEDNLGNFPVAYLGVLGYVLLLSIGILGMVKGQPQVKPGLMVSGFGLLVSTALMALSIAVIQAKCVWCMASAGIMLVLFGTYFWMNNLSFELKKAGKLEWISLVSGIAATVVAVNYFTTGEVTQTVIEGPIQKYIPANPKHKGNKDAEVIVLEFFDFTCVHCRKMNEELKDLLETSGNKFWLVMINSPLASPGHEQGPAAALIGEFAHEKGKFWDYFNRAFRVDASKATIDDFINIAGELGLDEVEINNRRKNPEDPVVKLWANDMNLTSKVGISETPMFFVATPGAPEVDVYTSKQFSAAMRTGKYRKYLFK